MNQYNKINALLRCPKYMKEHKKWAELYRARSLESREVLEKIYKKWGVEPFIVENIDNCKNLPEKPGVEVLKSDSEEFSAIRRVTKDRNGDDLRVARWEGGYLYLRVNINEKKEKLIGEFRDVIRLNQLRVDKSSKREKNTKINPWIVYDMHKKDGLNFSEIAQKLSGIKGAPTYNPELMAYYKAVKRAYDKALEMIKEVARV